jgi:hypothetical protein
LPFPWEGILRAPQAPLAGLVPQTAAQLAAQSKKTGMMGKAGILEYWNVGIME